MSDSYVANTYARALMPSSLENDSIKNRMDSLAFAYKALSEAKTADKFFKSPQILNKDKQEILKKTLQDIDVNVFNLLSLLIEKDRFSYLPSIVKECQKILDERFEVLKGSLSTALPLDTADLQQIINNLKKRYKKNIELKIETDPSLIAGGVLFIGNERIDFSAKGKLDRLKTDLMEMTLEKRSTHET